MTILAELRPSDAQAALPTANQGFETLPAERVLDLARRYRRVVVGDQIGPPVPYSVAMLTLLDRELRRRGFQLRGQA